MFTSLLSYLSPRSLALATTTAAAARPRASMVENLEGRTLLSATLDVAPAGPVVAGPVVHAPLTNLNVDKLAKSLDKAVDKSLKANKSVLPLRITGIALKDGGLVALGQIGKTKFDIPLLVTAQPNPNDADCPILNLEIGAINLNLLGLRVETSDICVRVTAESGPGNLLGNLLCGVSGALDGGLDLGRILGGLGAADLRTVTQGLTTVLNNVFGAITDASAVSGVGGTAAGATDILNLSVGPIDLNVLGLDVEVDDCDGGPVTVDITAESGPGNLLGNLLGGLAGALDGATGGGSVGGLINRISKEIGRLV